MATRKTNTKKQTTTRKPAKKTAAKKTATKKASPSRKGASAKKTATKKAASSRKKSSKGSCSTSQCTKKKCSKKQCTNRSVPMGASLVDRARECRDLEECRRFIVEMGDAIEQSNTWINEMHDEALSAEQTRDLYGEQISDLVEAIDLDQKRIVQLEKDLKAARKENASAVSQTLLTKLSNLSEEVKAIRSDLRRLLSGREPTAKRRRAQRQSERASERVERAAARSTPRGRKSAGRGSTEAPGQFAKYSVLRGAACSLGVGKHGYPPEVCAPAYFPRPVAAEILGTYAQNDYGGLAKWALMTGLPIDDVAIPAAPTKRSPRGRASSGRSSGTKKVAAKSSSRTKRTRTSSRSSAPKSASTSSAAKSGGRDSSQVLDRVLLTIARI